ncbi:glycine zipper 2TM domain-containing protein [Methylomagnum ishizawai]|uniref:glycine zipper 2TM domain-containing protein n=1 Tax=Methylomagnum ishizawai TaxID=1760988 RepID=UPI001C336E4E|nr:glycine zipper 2TM domain-containing protein [Methylomagnum ishizawai]BBL75517.1 hypothetical protein MishRS11D_26150 [Methylomagnum ishizawai]
MRELIVLATLAVLATAPTAHADGEGWRWEHEPHHHHHHHHHHHGWGRAYYPPPPAYYPPPPVVVERYYAPPPPRVIYREVPVYRQPMAYPRHHGRVSETVPMVAGGILGGAIGNQMGRGDPVATIGGAVLGTVIGHEAAE